ncbi:hypothetical protein HRG_005630 [Hirsutella rhossiliensis]|uniref:Uncharacterized protein n=1 Tax=Hirsutella rhossiliensis TaxID=111463 RepID=A0A9P8MXN4_9HYPO|nr:uncharacterized protein HRG_05630 [Hirsutella rhossiliensis]KAH0963120.1 hypothetical protein HRG_05630 [Hirsutella rhossiliensis]
MTGLIPLALGTSDSASKSRVSFLLPACDALHSKQNTMSPPLNSSPSRPKLPRLSPPRPPRRKLPSSAAEWTRALDDVKRACLSNRYDECSSRCLEILDLAAPDPVEPAYLVYLRFYAATALEAQASSQPSRPRRIALLQQAQAHYRAASLLAEQPLAPGLSRNSSPMPSLRSSTASDLSWSPVSSRMSSPDPSFGWPDDGPKTPEPAPVKAKKRVSFRDDVEPFIRPDSPTLGFESWPAPTPSRPASPESILKQDKALSLNQMPPSAAPQLTRLVEVSDDPFVDASRSPRYHSLLDGLRHDMLARVAALDTTIAACQAEPVSKHEEHAGDLKARAERLRTNGWRRPRFDAQRYQTLRENALADLAL